jgi:hypothetical protein
MDDKLRKKRSRGCTQNMVDGDDGKAGHYGKISSLHQIREIEERSINLMVLRVQVEKKE